MTLSELKNSNKTWFSKSNMRFFNDVSYKVLHGKTTKKPYLVRCTGGFSDMFGETKRYFYKINDINSDNSIGNLWDKDFRDLEAVKQELRFH